MADLFSPEWMIGFKDAWNSEPELTDALGRISFNSTIAYGFADAPAPKGVITIENGTAVSAGAYNGETLNWDLRATPESWNAWLSDAPRVAALGVAYTTGKLKFVVGDYAAMIKDPRMAGPFVKSFSVMGRV